MLIHLVEIPYRLVAGSHPLGATKFQGLAHKLKPLEFPMGIIGNPSVVFADKFIPDNHFYFYKCEA